MIPEPNLQTHQNRSLRLWEILGEEYDHLHNDEFVKRQRIVESNTLKEFTLLNTKELTTLVKKWLDPSKQDPVPLRSEVPFKKLAEWILAKHTQGGFSTDETLLNSIQMVFGDKIEDKNLVSEEPWMQDANLRSYTRGLLVQYLDQQSGFKLEKFLSSVFKTPVAEPVSFILLNRLLLEDVYGGSEYTEQKFTGLTRKSENGGTTAGSEGTNLSDTDNSDERGATADGYIKRVDDGNLNVLFEKMRDATQTALCLSGGGIRSATFALGVVQGLVKLKNGVGDRLLGQFTYLSTVSGGGYLGGWLSAWISHEGAKSVYDKLNSISNVPLHSAAEPLQHLRQYSNYLSPSLGLFSADTWTLVATYFRNLLLIWLVVLPFLAALVAVPWISVTIIASPPAHWHFLLVLLIVGTIALVLSDKFVYTYRPKSINGRTVSDIGSSQTRQKGDQASFLWNCLLPGALAIFMWTMAWYWFLYKDYAVSWISRSRSLFTHGTLAGLTVSNPIKAIGVITAGIVTLLVTEWIIFWLMERVGLIPRRYQDYKQTANWKELLVFVLVGMCAGPLLLLIAQAIPTHSTLGMNAALFTVFGFPAFLLAMLLLSFLYTGLMSTLMKDPEREWSARYSAWFFMLAVVWLATTGIVLFGPHLAQQAIGWVMTTGLASGSLTALLGQSSKLNGDRSKPKASSDKKPSIGDQVAQLALPIVAFITLVILVVVLSYFDMYVMKQISGNLGQFSTLPPVLLSVQGVSMVHPFAPILVSAGLLVIGSLLAWAVDTNRFSLHAMYRARLIRAYLGASRPAGERQPDPFTGFDEDDNLFMGNLTLPSDKSAPKTTDRKPFHLVNIALNLVSGRNLAWQERKATSFTVSPLHAGNLFLGYRRTYIQTSQKKPYPIENEGYYGGDRGISLGTAMTISGAAVSPNQGYHSSPLVAFFMTMFNARLGCWLGNPGPAGDSTFHLSSPRLAIRPIINEMIGNTKDTSDYVFLSDGGHFENLGLYEMVLRRNRFILLSDASCDEDCTLEDLGNAIRKIRIDLGIPIDFPLGFNIQSRTAPDPANATYWAMGRIRYSEVDMPWNEPSLKPDDYDGVLLYVKPGFYGTAFKGPRDIFNYASTSKSFPHESTGDQFFSESQFESYRALGIYVVERMQSEIITKFGKACSLEALFTQKGIQACLKKLC